MWWTGPESLGEHGSVLTENHELPPTHLPIATSGCHDERPLPSRKGGHMKCGLTTWDPGASTGYLSAFVAAIASLVFALAYSDQHRVAGGKARSPVGGSGC
jgi:hypothetical protein